MDHHVVVVSAEEIAPDTRRILVERPLGYEAWPGHAVDLAIDEEGWWDKPRPLTFRRTSDPATLEFIVRANADMDEVTRRIVGVGQGDRLVMSEAWKEDIPGAFFGGWRRDRDRAVRPLRQRERSNAA
ncbi:MAG TPA: hypothetical protein VMM55_11425 [Thermohalobaculum sp.]|nr:hypothetical protein [Thermohalobaculum sp.]